MFRAIKNNEPKVLYLLLQHGAQADAQIIELADIWKDQCELIKRCTWLTFSVILGYASCADVLIQNGATATAIDGSGISAIQLAQFYTRALHPRFCKIVYLSYKHKVSLEQDTETLAVLERAFASQVQNSKCVEQFRDIHSELDICYAYPKSQEIVM